VQVAEQRVVPAAEAVVGDRHRDRRLDADHFAFVILMLTDTLAGPLAVLLLPVVSLGITRMQQVAREATPARSRPTLNRRV
jgi:hypothetical protein